MGRPSAITNSHKRRSHLRAAFGLYWLLSADLMSAFPLQVVTIIAENINIPLIAYGVFNLDYTLVYS